MFDARIRVSIDGLDLSEGMLADGRGIAADHVTLAGFAIGVLAAVAIASGAFAAAFALVVLNRVFDGLDGAVARATRPTDRGAFLDIALDFAFYAAVPLAFGIADPGQNALAAACLLASFLANGAVFLAFAAMAEKRHLTTSAQGAKSLYYISGLAEGAETILVFLLACAWPAAFFWIAMVFAGLCCVSAIARIVLGWRVLSATDLLRAAILNNDKLS